MTRESPGEDRSMSRPRFASIRHEKVAALAGLCVCVGCRETQLLRALDSWAIREEGSALSRTLREAIAALRACGRARLRLQILVHECEDADGWGVRLDELQWVLALVPSE